MCVNMINYMIFICAFKSTWIRRLINDNTKWVKHFESELELKIKTQREKGWKEVLLDWVRTVKSFSQNDNKMPNEHIRFNLTFE